MVLARRLRLIHSATSHEHPGIVSEQRLGGAPIRTLVQPPHNSPCTKTRLVAPSRVEAWGLGAEHLSGGVNSYSW